MNNDKWNGISIGEESNGKKSATVISATGFTQEKNYFDLQPNTSYQLETYVKTTPAPHIGRINLKSMVTGVNLTKGQINCTSNNEWIYLSIPFRISPHLDDCKKIQISLGSGEESGTSWMGRKIFFNDIY
jgi:hypothetical protein